MAAYTTLKVGSGTGPVVSAPGAWSSIPIPSTKWCNAGSVGTEYFPHPLEGAKNNLQHWCSTHCHNFVLSSSGSNSMAMCCYSCNKLGCPRSTRTDLAVLMSMAEIHVPPKAATAAHGPPLAGYTFAMWMIAQRSRGKLRQWYAFVKHIAEIGGRIQLKLALHHN